MRRTITDAVAANTSLYGDNKLFYTQLDAINNLTRYIGNETELDDDSFKIQAGNLRAHLREPGYRTVVELSREPSISMAVMLAHNLKSDDVCTYLQTIVGFITDKSNSEVLDLIKGESAKMFTSADFARIGVYCDAAQEKLQSAWKEYFPTLSEVPPMNSSVWTVVDDVLSRPSAYPAIGRLSAGIKSQSAKFQFICGMCLAAMYCRPSTSVAEVYGR